jgi:putative oxidoreductase
VQVAIGRERIGSRPAARTVATIGRIERAIEILTAGPAVGARATIAFVLRLASGAVFVVFGVAKFTSHEQEADSFEDYGLPSPDAFAYAIGMVEVVGGLLLLIGLATRLAAVVLAGDMVGAIIASGIGEGETISLTLAPALLFAMAYLIWVGPGSHALDRGLRPQPARS